MQALKPRIVVASGSAPNPGHPRRMSMSTGAPLPSTCLSQLRRQPLAVSSPQAPGLPTPVAIHLHRTPGWRSTAVGMEYPVRQVPRQPCRAHLCPLELCSRSWCKYHRQTNNSRWGGKGRKRVERREGHPRFPIRMARGLFGGKLLLHTIPCQR